jgi:hypothetical protein
LRGEREAYASSFARPAFPVAGARYGRIINDFLMLNALRDNERRRGGNRSGSDIPPAGVELMAAATSPVLTLGHDQSRRSVRAR